MSKILKMLKKGRTDGASSAPTALRGPSDVPSATTLTRNSVEPPAEATTSKPSWQASRIGLIELGKGRGYAEKTVDVIAVHGLQGDAYKTWTHENGTMWLESILPDKIPFARIMTYGYNSTIAFSSSAADLEDKSVELINRLSMKRFSAEDGSTRPIVFICHSLGGILVKRALILAHERSLDTHYKSILDNTKAVAFLGVPHRGAEAAWWFSFVASALKSSALSTSTHTNLIKDLQSASSTLATISKQFIDRGQLLKIYTFFETRKLYGTVIVDKESALLNLSNEKLFPVDANHRTICHIPSADSQEYEALGAWIVELAWSIAANTSPKLLQITPAQSYFEVPNRRVSLFFGRADVISRIDGAFSAGPGPRIAVVQGMGGQGKSQVAMEYCHRTKEDPFFATFWIDAASENAVTRAFITISELISSPTDHLPDSDARIAFVSRKFTSWPTRLLLVFDNYDDPNDFPNIRDYFPQNELSAILVTGRHADIGTLVLGQDANLIELPGLEEYAAVNLLKHHSQVKESARKFSEEIVKRLGYHALAITQAGTYIKKGGIRLSEFLDVYNEEKEDILKNTPQLSQYRRKLQDAEKETSLNVFTTWQLSFQQLQSHMPEGSVVVKLLKLLAFFDNKDISEWTFLAYHRKHFDTKTHKLLEWINQYMDSESHWNSHLFKKDLVLLKDFCLLELSTQEQDEFSHASLHPLVKDWIRLQMDEAACQECSLMVAAILGNLLQQFWRNEHFELPLAKKQYLLLHVSAQEENNKEYFGTHCAELHQDLMAEYSISQSWFGKFLRNLGFYSDAATVIARLMETNLRLLGEEHTETLTSIASLAVTYWDQGWFEQAEALEVQLTETRKKVLGEDHPDTLVSMNNLAMIYCYQGHLDKAEELEMRVTETRKKVLGEHHPSTLTSMNNLGSIYLQQRRLDEAEELQLRVMESRKKVLGGGHPDTLKSKNNLAFTYWQQGRLKEAEELLVRTLESRKKVLGEEHPDTVASMKSLAYTYKDLNRNEKAVELMEKVVQLSSKFRGADHPNTAAAKKSLMVWTSK